jgi:hypothetical protein
MAVTHQSIIHEKFVWRRAFTEIKKKALEALVYTFLLVFPLGIILENLKRKHFLKQNTIHVSNFIHSK